MVLLLCGWDGALCGRNGAPAADYPWGDNVTQVNTDSTGYTAPPAGTFLDGSTGGRSAFFT
ncbi:MAG TPA: hypothetical protein VE733_06530 [Streptosporangiaceae bacterium]|jgi:hypothetical protein|nr:hypothetical protein [Streptosporangiaceae bacterium]